MQPENEPQSIEELRKRYEDLSHRKTQAQTRLDMAKQELEKLKAEARERHGTDDLDELRANLQAMEAENLQKRRQYQALLDRIEEELAKVGT
ncbi:MAG TPA: hypothetical protein VM328_11910 [Fimbriimonadaceae bacterium]|nr:hypothetical protein [Fimbriimonadaceae bacterium]